MDFSSINIPDILKSGMKNKFLDFPHFDFEDFIGQLFKDNGYEVVETPRTGDYGADLILTKSGEKIAVQVKRYAQENRVGVQEINQIIGAKDFYKCNKAMIITTSSFSKSGKKLANETLTDLWDWDKLQKYICDTYLEGKDYYAYFGDSFEMEGTEKTLEFEVKDAVFEVTDDKKPGLIFTLISVFVTNNTDANIDVILTLPTLITEGNRQVGANYYESRFFQKGVIYAGSHVNAMFIFDGGLVSSLNKGDRMIFKWIENEEEIRTYDYIIPRSFAPAPPPPLVQQKSYCYVVTMCYGLNSVEYEEMIDFRDNTLSQFRIGVWIIRAYYLMGGFLVKHLQRSEIAKRFSRLLINAILLLVRRWNRMRK